ncbi:hypothetical protein NM208_g5802 [Fusarium decemcellulare]|uniref:Uncharacterized protein n=1 Tax=Fusarium decemcellulare TaxID=57161 RepID=A0ACC1SFG3_9HYPO|nr:hypothetical protein NM208_g5802 [Fusarium decemcellulare]
MEPSPCIPAASCENNELHNPQAPPQNAPSAEAVGTRAVGNANESAVRPRHHETFDRGPTAATVSPNALHAASANGGLTWPASAESDRSNLELVNAEATGNVEVSGDAERGKQWQDHLVSGTNTYMLLPTALELDIPSQEDGEPSAREQPDAAVAPIKGLGLPHIDQDQGSKSKTSEITELGNSLYRARIAAQIPPPDQVVYRKAEGRLQRRLCKAVVQTGIKGERRGFLPNSDLERLINETSVTKELCKRSFRKLWHSSSQTDIEARARQICGISHRSTTPNDNRGPGTRSFKKIFAILLLIDRKSKIMNFVNEGVCDTDLPLHKVDLNKRKHFRLARKDRDATLNCFLGWKRNETVQFEEKQWTFLAPFFARGNENSLVRYNVPNDAILPFTSYTPIESHGGLNKVFKAQIHPSHYDFGPIKADNDQFAIKELQSVKRRSIQQEVEILESLSRKPEEHSHLISLLTVYEQHGNRHLVFPWAGGDLLHYWKVVNPNPEKGEETAIWLAQQSHGIAEGLSRIHRYETNSGTPLKLGSPISSRATRKAEAETSLIPKEAEKRREDGGIEPIRRLYGRHGDIKPENILWFPDPEGTAGQGTLKISDFGSTEVTTESAASERDKRAVWNSPTYRPPEFDLIDGIIGSPCDTWALGCLFLEFVAWYLGGQKYIKEFSDNRTSKDPGWEHFETDTFFVITDSEGQQKPELKPEVREYIKELHSDPGCTQHLHDFLRIIEDDMLGTDKKTFNATPPAAAISSYGTTERRPSVRLNEHTFTTSDAESAANKDQSAPSTPSTVPEYSKIDHLFEGEMVGRISTGAKAAASSGLEDSLEDIMRECMIQSYGPGRSSEFLPKDTFDQLFTKERITQELARVGYLPLRLRHEVAKGNSKLTELCVPMITGGIFKRRQILAILILVEKLEIIIDFISEGVDDTDLPFQLTKDEGSKRKSMKRRNNGRPPKIDLFDKWSPDHLEDGAVVDSRPPGALIQKLSDLTMVEKDALLDLLETRQSPCVPITQKIWNARFKVAGFEAETWKQDLPQTKTSRKRKRGEEDGMDARAAARKAGQPANLTVAIDDKTILRFIWKDDAGSLGREDDVRLYDGITTPDAEKKCIRRHDDIERQSIKQHNRDLITALARRRIAQFSKDGSLGNAGRPPRIAEGDMPTGLLQPKLALEHIKAKAHKWLALAADIEAS